MSDTSGTNSRVIDVINFLAAHPMESFTLSEVAGHLGLSNGSAHRVLTTLTEARYLSRHPKHKTYSLGMALVAIGQASLARHRNVDVARRELERLAAELKLQCTASTVVEGELLFLVSTGAPQSFDQLNRVGERQPFVLPIGLSHLAWSDPEVTAHYLSHLPTSVRDRVSGHFIRSLEAIRRRGFGIAGYGETLRAMFKVGVETIPDDIVEGISEKEIQLLDLDDIGPEGVSHIVAPVFSPTGAVSFELALSSLPARLTRPEIEHYIDRLRATAATITNETHGRMPQSGLIAGKRAATARKADAPKRVMEDAND